MQTKQTLGKRSATLPTTTAEDEPGSSSKALKTSTSMVEVPVKAI